MSRLAAAFELPIDHEAALQMVNLEAMRDAHSKVLMKTE